MITWGDVLWRTFQWFLAGCVWSAICHFFGWAPYPMDTLLRFTLGFFFGASAMRTFANKKFSKE